MDKKGKGKKPSKAQMDKFTWKPGDVTITPGPGPKKGKGKTGSDKKGK